MRVTHIVKDDIIYWSTVIKEYVHTDCNKEVACFDSMSIPVPGDIIIELPGYASPLMRKEGEYYLERI